MTRNILARHELLLQPAIAPILMFIVLESLSKISKWKTTILVSARRKSKSVDPQTFLANPHHLLRTLLLFITLRQEGNKNAGVSYVYPDLWFPPLLITENLLFWHCMVFAGDAQERRRHITSLHKVLKGNHELMKEKCQILLYATNVCKDLAGGQVLLGCFFKITWCKNAVALSFSFLTCHPNVGKCPWVLRISRGKTPRAPTWVFEILSMPTRGYGETLRSLVLVTNHVPTNCVLSPRKLFVSFFYFC